MRSFLRHRAPDLCHPCWAAVCGMWLRRGACLCSYYLRFQAVPQAHAPQSMVAHSGSAGRDDDDVDRDLHDAGVRGDHGADAARAGAHQLGPPRRQREPQLCPHSCRVLPTSFTQSAPAHAPRFVCVHRRSRLWASRPRRPRRSTGCAPPFRCPPCLQVPLFASALTPLLSSSVRSVWCRASMLAGAASTTFT